MDRRNFEEVRLAACETIVDGYAEESGEDESDLNQNDRRDAWDQYGKQNQGETEQDRSAPGRRHLP